MNYLLKLSQVAVVVYRDRDFVPDFLLMLCIYDDRKRDMSIAFEGLA